MKHTQLPMGLILIGIGAGIAMMIVLWTADTGPAKDPAQPHAAGIDPGPDRDHQTTMHTDPSQPSGQPQPAAPPASGSAPRLSPAGSRSTITATGVADNEASVDGKTVYTMDRLPRGTSGIYWVRDSDGRLIQVAVDVPGQDSPAGPQGNGPDE